MKKIILSLITAVVVLTSCKSEKKEKVVTKEAAKVEVNAENLNNVNTEKSVLMWKGTKPTGSHNGTVALKSGGLVVENGTIKEGVFVIDMNSIVNKDMEGSKGAGKLEGHLKSADFFDAEKFPTSKFVITGVENKGDNIHVTGNLTIKDVTKSITIPAMVSEENGITTFKSETFNVNRADFNVKYGSKSFFDNLKDKFIDDMMELQFTVITK